MNRPRTFALLLAAIALAAARPASACIAEFRSTDWQVAESSLVILGKVIAVTPVPLAPKAVAIFRNGLPPPTTATVEIERIYQGACSQKRIQVSSGLAAIETDSNVMGLQIMPCDQPLITPHHLQQVGALATRDNIVSASFNDTFGSPVIFGRRFFPPLAELPDNHGAKSVLYNNRILLRLYALPDAAQDMYRPQDLRQLRFEPARELVDLRY